MYGCGRMDSNEHKTAIYALMLVMNELSHKIDTTSIMNETLTQSVCIAQYFKTYELI